MPLYTADGVAECLKAVRMQLREGARVIKFAASGGVATELVRFGRVVLAMLLRDYADVGALHNAG